MLVIARKTHQRVLLQIEGVEVWITVTRCEPGSVRLGFVAPKEVVILREELLTKEEEEATPQ